MVWASLPAFFSWKTASEALWLASSISLPSCLPLSESCFASAFLPLLKASCKVIVTLQSWAWHRFPHMKTLRGEGSHSSLVCSQSSNFEVYLRLFEVLTTLFSVLVGFCSPVVMGLIASCWGGLLLAHSASKSA